MHIVFGIDSGFFKSIDEPVAHGIQGRMFHDLVHGNNRFIRTKPAYSRQHDHGRCNDDVFHIRSFVQDAGVLFLGIRAID